MIPLILMVVFSFTIEDGNKIVFSLDNYQRLMNPIYLKVFLRSIILAGASTIICLLVGYPVAYIISKAHISKRNTLILLFILPMWMNFLLRTYAWVAILGKNGILNSFLGLFGIEPVTLLYTNFAILLGMVYNFYHLWYYLYTHHYQKWIMI
ncbi:putative aBC-type transport system,spermidine/putrescine permease [[Clostridium] sordellii ATCC 9714]|nr:putative aBC-type transport system,spermidine/putrescine permease [[Clostridium] sordellii ATCC 9714] [Paeniclostridium sordellii ATCC 9714]